MTAVVHITIIFTKHSALGQCNESALLGILEHLNPEVIFEEMRSSDFDALYRDEAKYTLEMRAVSKYVAGRNIQQVPVDDFAVITEDLRDDLVEINSYLKMNNREYLELMQLEDEETFRYGFPYLNSPQWEALDSRIRVISEETIVQSNNEYLLNTLSTWNNLIRKREVAMVENIYTFCRDTRCASGVFLVGSAHKRGIVEAIAKRPATEYSLIQWKIGI